MNPSENIWTHTEPLHSKKNEISFSRHLEIFPIFRNFLWRQFEIRQKSKRAHEHYDIGRKRLNPDENDSFVITVLIWRDGCWKIVEKTRVRVQSCVAWKRERKVVFVSKNIRRMKFQNFFMVWFTHPPISEFQKFRNGDENFDILGSFFSVYTVA